MKKHYIYGKIKKCLHCGAEFQPRDADTKTYTSKYCSHSCRNKARAIHKEITCKQCGKIFKPIRKEQNFCSRQCAGTHKKEHHKPSVNVVINKKMAQFCCGLIHRCLRSKTEATVHILGYTAKELKIHLENHFEEGMTWENYGNKVGNWSIDHTKPISKFNKDSTLMEINALTNLRPMWHTQNCSKKNKWEGL